eukprot:GHVU01131489.1.p1 GENE.GHVU01131489.1~~GHVU01131489.1.p1  ORF type:complete len:102 (+),score=0.35 GHVU01131489.1:322-627(+)
MLHKMCVATAWWPGRCVPMQFGCGWVAAAPFAVRWDCCGYGWAVVMYGCGWYLAAAAAAGVPAAMVSVAELVDRAAGVSASGWFFLRLRLRVEPWRGCVAR